MQHAVSEDPLVAVLQAFPCGVVLLRDSLAADGHFLLPWVTSAALGQGHKVGGAAAAGPVDHLGSHRCHKQHCHAGVHGMRCCAPAVPP